jgi:hypothetical protein
VKGVFKNSVMEVFLTRQSYWSSNEIVPVKLIKPSSKSFVYLWPLKPEIKEL